MNPRAEWAGATRTESNMTDAPTDARKLMDGKLSIPGEMRTAEWAMLPQWLRERSFYMAGVHQAEALSGFRAEVEKIAQGESSIPESERRLSEMLAGIGYKPLPGQEGTIKDLTHWRRMRVSLRTNVELLQGWGQRQRGMTRGALMAFPAWELIRIMPRSEPRDWPTRFTLSGGEIRDGRMIAMKDSLVWQELGNFEDGLHVDYPPFAWGSGMGWKAIGYREADKLGVIPADWTPPPREPVSSPNAGLETTPKISDRAMRDELARRMKGLAEWQGDKFVFTDPNGTRPMPAEKLVEVWDKGMPDTFHDLPGEGLMQKEALTRWLGDHEQFRDANDENAWEDLLRLAGRVISRPVERLWRGMSMSSEKLDDFLRDIEAIYTTRTEFPLESWTDSAPAAATYARTGGKGWSVLLDVANPRKAADFSALARAYATEVSKQPKPPLMVESEWVYPTGRRFKTVNVTKDGANRTVHITLEELP